MTLGIEARLRMRRRQQCANRCGDLISAACPLNRNSTRSLSKRLRHDPPRLPPLSRQQVNVLIGIVLEIARAVWVRVRLNRNRAGALVR